MSTNSVERFMRLLKQSPAGAVFNPWWETDEENDIARIAPLIRRQQLRRYLEQRLGRAKIALIGEALGYRGGHFSGIPMTSERILLGNKPGISGAHRAPLKILVKSKPRRTSKPSICADGFSEPTATIVWGALLKIGLLPDEFVLWNAFPWHSFDPRRGFLSNRMPNKSEQAEGLTILKAFLELVRCDEVIALGKIAAAQLKAIGIKAHCVRHPASGGAKLFRQQIARLLPR